MSPNASLRRCRDGRFRIFVSRDLGFMDPVSKGFETLDEALREARMKGYIFPNSYWDEIKQFSVPLV